MISFLRLVLLVTLFSVVGINAFSQKHTDDTYRKEFLKIDSFARVTQPRAALSLINKLNGRARTEGNEAMLVKSTLYRMLFQSYLEEDALNKILIDLRKDIDLAKQPEKSILQSLLAETYWKYYTQYAYQLYRRAGAGANIDNDIKTWSLSKLTGETTKIYMASLTESKLLQNTKIDVLDGVLTGDTATRYLRPTLYDLLAQRALETFLNTSFYIRDEDQDSGLFYGLVQTIFGQLISYHTEHKNLAALADAELKQIKFNYQRRPVEDNDHVYLAALQSLAKKAVHTEIYADILYEEAAYEQGKKYGLSPDPERLVKAISLAEEAIKTYPDSYGAKNAASLLKLIKNKQLDMELRSFNLPGKPVKVMFSYINVDTAYLKLYKIPADLAYEDPDLKFKELYDSFISSHQPLRQWPVVLPAAADYQEHRVLDQFAALPAGKYLLIARNNKNDTLSDARTSYASFNVTGMAVTTRSVENNYQYMVTDNLSGVPMKGVHITENASEYVNRKPVDKKGRSLLTDEDGRASSRVDVRVSYLLVTNKKDSVVIPVQGNYSHYKPEGKRVLWFTDRPVYRPGQTIFYKGLFMQNEKDGNSILADQQLDLTFWDVNSREIEKVSATTNSYGTFSGSFKIPMGKLNGNVKLKTLYGSIDVRVEEYKRPAFEVVFDALQQKYKLKDSIKVTGRAVTFSDYAVSGAKVKYTVYRSVLNQYSYRLQNPLSGQIVAGTAETKAGGEFSFSFLAGIPYGNKGKNDKYAYEVKLEITDLNGETRSASKTINAGDQDILLQADIPERLFLTEKTGGISYKVVNLNGQGIKAKLRMEWFALQYPGRILRKDSFFSRAEHYMLTKEQYAATFPDEDYAGNSNPANWPVKKMVLEKEMDQGEGRIGLDEDLLKPGYYKVRLTAVNADNDTVNTEQVVRIYHHDVTVIQSLNEWLVPEKTVITPGETAIFRIAGALPSGKAYYEVYYKGTVAEKGWLKTSPGQRMVHITSRPEFKDEFAVQFTQVQNGQIYTAMQIVKIIDSAKELDIKFLTFRNKLQPGEKESWKLQISNKAGEKEMAEMVATLYDASLDDFKRMNWNSLSPPVCNYSGYNWLSPLNNTERGREVWSLKNYNGISFNGPRKYESLNLFGYDYAWANKQAYRNYLENLEKIRAANLPRQAAKKLETLQKGDLLYGVVTDEQGYALMNVDIRLGKTRVLTDEFGIYQINAVEGNELQFSAVGSLMQKVKAGKNKRLDVSLMNNRAVLNEVMYSKQHIPKEGMQAALNGTVSGLSYDKTTGMPMAPPAILVEDTKVYDFVSIDPRAMAPTRLKYMVDGKWVTSLTSVVPRTNFNETAFFYPQLQTDADGQITIDFTIPQSLTRYRMMGFAHTKELKTASVNRELITQKQMAISANAPRFFREGDTILLTAKLNNLSGQVLKGNAVLELRNALTGNIISILLPEGKGRQDFELADKGAEVLTWSLLIPSGIDAISYKLLAASGVYSDGEEMTIPVLPNSMLITESMPLNVRGNTKKIFTMDKLLHAAASKTLRSNSLTVEFTSNPAWYAIQSLPYLMEYPSDCTEQTFSRFYANSFAAGIMNSSPKIKEVFNRWQQSGDQHALLSGLEQNPELKSVLLKETPWVMQAADETQRKKRLGMLFDLNRMSYELKSTLQQLEKMQLPNGSFPWFNGMNEDRYMTQYIILGMAQLKQLKLVDEKANPEFNRILDKAVLYLDNRLKSDYNTEKNSAKDIASLPLHYLYARSYLNRQNNDPELKKAIDDYLKKLIANWKYMEVYQQGQAALILQRSGNKAEAIKIINLLKERAQHSDEMGMYWADNRAGWWWYQNPVETQSLLIEAFDEVTADTRSVEEMKIWLLKNKQTSDWKTTKATAAACYALLRRGTDLSAEMNDPDVLIGGKIISGMGMTGDDKTKVNNKMKVNDKMKMNDEVKANDHVSRNDKTNDKEAGTGYQKFSIPGAEVKPSMGKIEIKNNNQVILFGGIYWQYFEQLDKITAAETGLKVKKQLFLQQQKNNRDVLIPLTAVKALKTGDLVKVRMEVYTDRDMEYVHLKDMHSSGFDPVNTISGYKYQNGLGYYESIKDASANFFIGHLRKGVYVFEYALRVTHAGNFSNGISSLQCMYAPEFTAHTEGNRVTVK